MKEIKEYDLAAQRFYNSIEFKAMPLLSWDLYAPHFDKICGDYKDLRALEKIAQENKWTSELDFKESFLANDTIVVVTDPEIRIVHATQNIYQMNGYLPEDIIGKRPKMFQGKNTCTKTSAQIGEAVSEQKPFEAVILNYRKDGSPYKCWIKGVPIFDTSDTLVNFIAYEKEVA